MKVLGSKQVMPEGCNVNFEADQPRHQLRLTRVLAVLMKVCVLIGLDKQNF